MLVNLCQTCRRVNAPEARYCDRCGAFLYEADTQRMPLLSPGANPPPAEPAPPAAGALAAAGRLAGDLAITLRDVAAPPSNPPLPTDPMAQPGEELVVSDLEPRPQVFERDDAAAAPSPAPAARARVKAERRAAVRRQRQQGRPAAMRDPQEAPRVLVCDADEEERERLAGLLRDFGFAVHAVMHADTAAALVAAWPFVAAFVDVDLDAADGGAGIELCRQVRTHGRARSGDGTFLVRVSAELGPLDRVRAELAGCEANIDKPVTRGSVAGVLDRRGIALPSDPRRS